MTHMVSDDSFEKDVLQSKQPVLVDFWAEWCGPCKALGPVLEQLSNELGDKVKVVKMNIDDNPKVPSGFGIRSIPTMILFKDGKVVDTKVGALQKQVINEWLKQHCEL